MGILTDLIILSLEINEYDSVHRWADRIIASKPDYLKYCQDPRYGYMVAGAGKACFTAYYGKGFASLKQGNHTAAIQHLTNASLCDSSCHATYYLLKDLKRTEDFKELAQISEEERLQPERGTLERDEDIT